MKLIIIVIIILLILFLPLPIKIKLEYIDKNLIIKLYKHTIFSSKKGVENKYLKKLLKKKPDIKNNKTNSKLQKKYNKKISYKNLYRNLSKNRLKPKIKIKVSLSYGIDDAAASAILYGLLCNIPTILYFILSIIFKVKDLSFDIDPKFNSTLLTFGITSIFYFNIANIICILFLLFKSKENKEVAPNLGRNI